MPLVNFACTVYASLDIVRLPLPTAPATPLPGYVWVLYMAARTELWNNEHTITQMTSPDQIPVFISAECFPACYDKMFYRLSKYNASKIVTQTRRPVGCRRMGFGISGE